MERKKLLSGLLAGITIFVAFGTLVYLLNQGASPVQACGQKCYYGWNCGSNEVCAGWGLFLEHKRNASVKLAASVLMENVSRLIKNV